MHHSDEEIPHLFHRIIEGIAEYVSLDEKVVLIGGLVAVCVFLVFVTFLITRFLYNRKSDDMSTPEERAKYSDRLTYHPPTAERGEAARPQVDELLERDLPFKKAELGTLDDIKETSVSSGDSDVAMAPPTTAYPEIDPIKNGYAIIFAYRMSEEYDGLPDSHVNKEINKMIDAASIPVGMVGVPYECVIDFEPIQKMLHVVNIKPNTMLSERLGLKVELNGSRVRIFGTPLQPHEGQVNFCYRKSGSVAKSSDEFSYLSYPKELLVNPHPQSLWKNLEVADYEGYKNKDDDFDGVEVVFSPEKKGSVFSGSVPAQTIEILMASRRGRSHAHVGKPRDDCFYYEIDKETGWNFVAVADGAGSAKYSRKGSEIACKTVVEQLHGMMASEYDTFLRKEASLQLGRAKMEFKQLNGQWDEDILQSFAKATKLEQIYHKAIDTTIRTIHQEAEQREGAIVKDYHTTLLCVAFKYFEPTKDPKEMSGWFFASYWVGDGGAAILRWNGTDRVLVLGEPDGGEFAGQTRFLTIPDEIQPETIKKRVRFSFCDSFEALLLVTDGITDPFFPSEAAVVDEPRWFDFYERKLARGSEEKPEGCPSLFDNQQTPLQKSKNLFGWLDFWSKGNHDDRTILIVKPR